ncbi:MAG: hypothetical protein DCC75_04785, partial [Proteobacteria bacterium]
MLFVRFLSFAALVALHLVSVSDAFANLPTPRNVRASDGAFPYVNIAWDVDPNMQGPGWYTIYRRDCTGLSDAACTIDCTDQWLLQTNAVSNTHQRTGLNWNDNTATPGRRYRYAVNGFSDNFLGGYFGNWCSTLLNSTDVGSRQLPAPSFQSGFPTTTDPNGIQVQWHDFQSNYGVSFWLVYSSTNSGNGCNGPYASFLRPNRAWTNTINVFNQNVYHWLRAIDDNGAAGACSSVPGIGRRPAVQPSVGNIAVHPAAVVAAGTNVTLSVSATGAIPANTVAYRWSRSGSQISGATSSSYTFTGQSGHGTQQYDVVVTHPESSFSQTRSQQITVCRSDQVVLNNSCACPGNLQEIGGQCGCPAPLIQVGNQCLAPTPTPTPTPLPNSAPQITEQPVSQTVQEGQSVTFSVVASGNPAPNYQWFRDSQNPVGGNNPQYSFVAALSDNGARFKVRVSNLVGSIDSNEVLLTVQAAPRALRPVAECVMANNDGTVTAFFGYENQNNAVVSIPAGTNANGNVNSISGGTILPGTQHPVDFSPGRVRGVVGVVFPSDGSVAFTLGYQGTGASTQIMDASSTPCSPIEPRLACVNPEGAGFRARFSYSNQNSFNIIIPSGPNNRFSPAPEFRDQPINFLAGLGQSEHFEVVSSTGEALTWTLANLSATADSASTPCFLPPICDAGGPYRVQQGQNQVILNASGSFDPEGSALTYAWSTTCAGANVAGTLSPLATLNLVGNRSTCSVNLAVSDGSGVSQCSAEVSFEEVPVCLNDRCGVPCGDGMSCCGCVQVDNSAAILATGENFGQLELGLKKSVRLVRRLAA